MRTPTSGSGRAAAAWAAAGPALLLVAVAWSFVPLAGLPSFDGPKLFVLLAGGGVLALCAGLASRGARDAACGDPLFLVPFALALVALVAAFAAGVRGSLTGPILACGALVGAWLVASAQDGAAATLRLARGAAVAALGAGLYAVLQKAGGDPAPWGARRDVVASFGNVGFAAAFQAAALPFAVLLAARREGSLRDRLLGTAAVLLSVTHLLLARSRIDLAAAAAGLGVCLLYALDGRGRRTLARVLWLSGAAAAIVLALLFVRAAGQDAPGLLGRSDTVAVRLHVWSTFPALVTHVPLWLPQGTPFVDLYPALRPAEEYLLSLGRVVSTPHNDVLGLMVTLGVAGVLPLLAAASALLRRLRGAGEDLLLRSAVAASLAALAVSALASSPLTHVATATLGGLAWGAALALRPRRAPLVRLPARAVGVGLAALLAALAVPALAAFRGDAFLALGRGALASGDVDEALRNLDVAAGLDRRGFAARYELGTLLHNAGDGPAAIAALRAAHAIRPGSPECRASLARALLGAGRLEQGRELLTESLDLCAWHPELLTARADLALFEDRPRDAVEDLAAARKLLPHDPRLEALHAGARLAAREPGARVAALAALKRLLAAEDREQVRRSVLDYLRRDPGFLPALIATARRLSRETPQSAAVLVASAVEDLGAQADQGFLLEGGQVLLRAGWKAAGGRLIGRAYGLQAAQMLDRGLAEQALRLAKKAAPRDPDPEHYLTVARALARLGERSDAISAVGSALATGPLDPALLRADPDIGGLLPDERLEQLIERAERIWTGGER